MFLSLETSPEQYFHILRLKDDWVFLLNKRQQKNGQWYLVGWSRKGSPTPQRRTLSEELTMNRSMSELEVSVKWVFSVLICFRLNSRQSDVILELVEGLLMSRFKSPVTIMSVIPVSTAREMGEVMHSII